MSYNINKTIKIRNNNSTSSIRTHRKQIRSIINSLPVDIEKAFKNNKLININESVKYSEQVPVSKTITIEITL